MWVPAQRPHEPWEPPWTPTLALELARRGDGYDEPSLRSLRRADVAGLTVAHVDMRACQLAGAHRLDQLRIEGGPFAKPLGGVGYTDRETIAEEHHWRRTRWRPWRRRGFSGKYWYHPETRPPAWLEAEPLRADQIAGLYRALRKGREDNKDEPGAADFYYGEMEMRRHAKREQARHDRRQGHRGPATTAAAEHAILWLYWLISGYGLRAWRAVVTILVVL